MRRATLFLLLSLPLGAVPTRFLVREKTSYVSGGPATTTSSTVTNSSAASVQGRGTRVVLGGKLKWCVVTSKTTADVGY